MSIQTLIKKYEEELPNRWTREGERAVEWRPGVFVPAYDDCEVCGSERNAFGACACYRKALAEAGHYPKEWL